MESCGDKGHNVEYVLKLAEWMQRNLPDVIDHHLVTIERAVRFKISQRNLCLDSLMGHPEGQPKGQPKGQPEGQPEGQPKGHPEEHSLQGKKIPYGDVVHKDIESRLDKYSESGNFNYIELKNQKTHFKKEAINYDNNRHLRRAISKGG